MCQGRRAGRVEFASGKGKQGRDGSNPRVAFLTVKTLSLCYKTAINLPEVIQP
jgi:hypothetical protein